MKTFLKRPCIWQILHVIHFICDRVCKHHESITTGSRKSPTSRLRFQFHPRLQAAALADRSVQRCMKSNTPIRCVRLEAALRRMVSVWHQSTARAIREQTDPMHSNRSRGTLMSYTDHSAQRRFKSNTPKVKVKVKEERIVGYRTHHKII